MVFDDGDKMSAINITGDIDATTEQTQWTDIPSTIGTEEITSVFYEDFLIQTESSTIALELSSVLNSITNGNNDSGIGIIANTTSSTSKNLIETSYLPSTTTTTTHHSVNNVENVCAAVFMTIFIITSIIGNFTIVTSLRHNHYKRVALYSLLSNICVTLLCDSVLNMTLILGATIVGFWPYGSFLCQLSAFLLNILSVETLLALTVTVFDRFLATKYHRYYLNHMNRAKANILSGFTWIYSTGFTLAILIGPDSIPSRSFPFSYLCNLTSNTDLAYKITVLFFCYFLPLIAIFVMFVVIIRIGINDTVETQSLNNRTLYGFEVTTRTPLSDELRRSRSVGLLFIAWCVLQAPYAVLHSLYIFTASDYPDGTLTSGSHGDIVYPTILETTFAWMKFSYVTIAPILIFASWSEAREELRNLLCQKNNVVDSGRSTSSQDPLHKPGVRSSWASTSDESNSLPSTLGRAFQVPILMATANGLRLKVGTNQKETDIDENGEMIVPTADGRESRYLMASPEPLSPFGAIETVEEVEEGAIPSKQKRPPSLTLKYNDSGYGRGSALATDYSSTFQLSLNNSGSSPRRTPVTPSSPSKPSLPSSPRSITSPRSLTSIEYNI